MHGVRSECTEGRRNDIDASGIRWCARGDACVGEQLAHVGKTPGERCDEIAAGGDALVNEARARGDADRVIAEMARRDIEVGYSTNTIARRSSASSTRAYVRCTPTSWPPRRHSTHQAVAGAARVLQAP